MKRSKKIGLCFILMLFGMALTSLTIYNAHKHITIVNNTASSEPIKYSNNSVVTSAISKTETSTPNALTFGYTIFICLGAFSYALGLVYFFISDYGKKSAFSNAYRMVFYGIICLIVTGLISYGMISLTNDYLLPKANVNVSETN